MTTQVVDSIRQELDELEDLLAMYDPEPEYLTADWMGWQSLLARKIQLLDELEREQAHL